MKEKSAMRCWDKSRSLNGGTPNTTRRLHGEENGKRKAEASRSTKRLISLICSAGSSVGQRSVWLLFQHQPSLYRSGRHHGRHGKIQRRCHRQFDALNSQNPGLYNTVHIFGDNGAAVGVRRTGTSTAIPNSGDVPFNDLWTIPGEESLREKWKEEDKRFFASHSGSSYFLGLQIADFSDAIREERDPLVTGWDGLETVRLIDGIYRSFRTGKPILY